MGYEKEVKEERGSWIVCLFILRLSAWLDLEKLPLPAPAPGAVARGRLAGAGSSVLG